MNAEIVGISTSKRKTCEQYEASPAMTKWLVDNRLLAMAFSELERWRLKYPDSSDEELLMRMATEAKLREWQQSR